MPHRATRATLHDGRKTHGKQLLCALLCQGNPGGGVKIGYQPSNQNDTLQGTNISPKNGILKMIESFSRLVGYVNSLEGTTPS